jgi:DNA-binding response OmpR family regulator
MAMTRHRDGVFPAVVSPVVSHSALIIEPDAQSAKLFSTVLEQAGWVVVVAHSVEAGRRLLGVLRTDLIVLEPGGAMESRLGHVYSLVKASGSTVPIAIVSSANGWLPLPAGCVGYLRKPIDVATFATELAALLEKPR